MRRRKQLILPKERGKIVALKSGHFLKGLFKKKGGKGRGSNNRRKERKKILEKRINAC